MVEWPALPWKFAASCPEASFPQFDAIIRPQLKRNFSITRDLGEGENASLRACNASHQMMQRVANVDSAVRPDAYAMRRV